MRLPIEHHARGLVGLAVTCALLGACGGGDERPSSLSGAEARPPMNSDSIGAALGDANERAKSAVGTVVLPGTGLRIGLTAGCDPVIGVDFVDNASWNNRRLAPRDCERMTVNPPMFIWREPADRNKDVPWTFTLRGNDGSVVMTTRPTSPAQLLAQGLPIGDYQWAVVYERHGDHAVVSSQWRRFTIGPEARATSLPLGHEVAERVAARAAPRLLPEGTTFPEIAAKLRLSEYAAAFQNLLDGADRLVTALPAQEPAPFVGPVPSLVWKHWKQAVIKVADDELTAMQILGVAWRLTGSPRYRDAAVARLSNLAAWDPEGTTGHVQRDYANENVYMALAFGIDLLSGAAPADVVNRAIASLKVRIKPVYDMMASLDVSPYNSHQVGLVQTVASALTVALLAGHPAFPESKEWLATTWDYMLRTVSTWGDDRGSWGNGVTYAWNCLYDLSEVMAGIRLAAGVNLAEHPWPRNFGNFLMAHTPPLTEQTPNMGDGLERRRHYFNGLDVFKVMTRLTKNPQHVWYQQQAGVGASGGMSLNAVSLMLMAVEGPDVAPLPPTEPSVAFEDAGSVAMFNDPAAGFDRSSLYFRSSRFGSYSHSHADQNAFTLVSRGKDILISGGYYPYWVSPHHVNVTRATRYKNALTFDGGIGQAEPVPTPFRPGAPLESMDARGELLNFAISGPWTVATGDATLAYRGWNASERRWEPLLTNAVRSVAYNRQERVAIVYDWATSEIPRRWELNFNARAPFTAHDERASVAFDGASGCIEMFGLVGGFTLSAGFDFPPERSLPVQYQARFNARERSQELTNVTVIREDCRQVSVSVQQIGRAATVSIGEGVALTFDGRTVVLPAEVPSRN